MAKCIENGRTSQIVQLGKQWVGDGLFERPLWGKADIKLISS